MEFKTGDTVILFYCLSEDYIAHIGFYTKISYSESYMLAFDKFRFGSSYSTTNKKSNMYFVEVNRFKCLTHRIVLTEKYIIDFKFI